ncbi:MAG: hypothetical protein ACYCOR_12725 [Acidobacteriaceae bacterium]
MKRVATGILSLALLAMPGCKTATATGTATAPTLTFAQATNASLQAAHKFGVDIAASVGSGKLVLTPTEKQAFDAFAASLNATDAIFIAFEGGSATQAQVTTAVANTTALQATVQTVLTQGGK